MRHLFAAIFVLALAPFGVAGGAIAADSEIVGSQIVDSAGEPLIGVSVLAEGSKEGVVTDLDGKFRIKPPAGATNLKISYTGMQPQTIPLSNVPPQIVLEDDTRTLEEVVVIGCRNANGVKNGYQTENGKKCYPDETGVYCAAICFKWA